MLIDIYPRKDILKADKQVKILISLSIREMQIKCIITCHFTSVRMAIINKDKQGKVLRKDVKKLKLSCVAGETVKCCSFFEKQFGIELSCDVSNILFWYCSNKK